MDSPTRLRLGTDPELVFEPYEYEEWHEGDGLRIRFKSQVTAEQTESYFETLLKTAGDYFPVEREGAEEREDPPQMRFGGVDWSRHGDAGDKHVVNLVEDLIDEQGPSARRGLGLLGQPQVKWELSYLLEYVGALVNLLEKKGVLDDGERERLHEHAVANRGRRQLDFSRVPDVDDLR